jgi:hypothetical protein
VARPLSDELAQAVTYGGGIETTVDVYGRDGSLLCSSHASETSGDDTPRIYVVDGSISTDESRDVPGSGALTVLVDAETAAGVLPYSAGSPLSPINGAMVYVGYRATAGGATTPYGAYEVLKAEIDESAEGITLGLSLADRAQRIKRAKLWRGRKIIAGSSYTTAFEAMLISALGDGVNVTIEYTSIRTPLLTWGEDDDRLEAVNSLATAIGYRVEWNANGVGDVWVGPDTDTGDEPIWTIYEGGNTLVSRLNRELSDEDTYNGVVARGESAASDGPPIRYEKWDTDPDSLTYFDPDIPEASAMGPVPYVHSDKQITSNAQAASVCEALLPKKLGLVERLRIERPLHPGIQVADPIYVERPSIGASGVFIVESTNVALKASAGRMSIVCRERRLFQ